MTDDGSRAGAGPRHGAPALARGGSVAMPTSTRAGALGMHLAVRRGMDPWLALTDLWWRAIETHEARPLTWSAALAAAAVAREDRRREATGIPSIFDPAPAPTELP